MLSGREDEVVPAKLMDRLWDVARTRGRGGGGGTLVGCTWCGGTSATEKRVEGEDDDEGPVVPVADVFERFEKGTHCEWGFFLAGALLTDAGWCRIGNTPNLKEY